MSLKLKIPQVEPYQYIRIHPFQSFGSATTQHQEGPRIHQNVDLSKIFGPSSEDFGGWDPKEPINVIILVVWGKHPNRMSVYYCLSNFKIHTIHYLKSFKHWPPRKMLHSWHFFKHTEKKWTRENPRWPRNLGKSSKPKLEDFNLLTIEKCDFKQTKTIFVNLDLITKYIHLGKLTWNQKKEVDGRLFFVLFHWVILLMAEILHHLGCMKAYK